jgi:hypothetical protein
MATNAEAGKTYTYGARKQHQMMNTSSTYLPPAWMVRNAIEDVARRRLSHAPAFRKLVQASPDSVQQYLEWNKAYAILALYPQSERPAVESRIRRFGQGFPGLFNINGEPRAHDVRSRTQNAPSFFGSLNIEKPGPLLAAERLFEVGFRSNCVFRIEPDASIKIGGFIVRSHNRAPKRFKYRIHFVYIVAFGFILTPLNFLEYFERELVLHFGFGADMDQRQEISESIVL